MMQSLLSMGVVTGICFIFGFSMSFGPDINGIIGGLQHVFMKGVGMALSDTYGTTIPFIAFFTYQQMSAIITPALITSVFTDRVNFKRYLWLVWRQCATGLQYTGYCIREHGYCGFHGHVNLAYNLLDS